MSSSGKQEQVWAPCCRSRLLLPPASVGKEVCLLAQARLCFVTTNPGHEMSREFTVRWERKARRLSWGKAGCGHGVRKRDWEGESEFRRAAHLCVERVFRGSAGKGSSMTYLLCIKNVLANDKKDTSETIGEMTMDRVVEGGEN